MYAMLIVVAALWGAAAGLLVPRAAYRLSVEPEERWRDSCQSGHALVGPARGWLGGPGCAACADRTPGARTASADRTVTPDPQHSAPCLAPSRLAPSLLTALACAVLAAATGPRPELAVWLLYAPFAVLLSTVDVRVHRLPDQLTLPLAAATPLLLLAAELLPYEAGSWLHALLGGLALGGGYLVLFLIHPNGMGLGDVKLALSLGVALGWYDWGILFVGAFSGFLLGSLYGLGLVLARRGSRKSAIPFGPFMISGALFGVLMGAFVATP
ncbi:A24 family peptidase [Streptomyces sp. NBC_01353]|uniref:A24 family peptidase n=1 Tax=Streptomyces sp. NBC_01353 TaxID=2903835 RepID=UPI002E31839A|nr:A24 family peptidase [Streptomyces sp. NBC_01353]